MDSSSNSNGLDGSAHLDDPHTIPKEDETDAKAVVLNGIEKSGTNSEVKSGAPLVTAIENVRLDEGAQDTSKTASSLTSDDGDVADARPAAAAASEAVGANDATDAEPGPTRGRQYENISLPEVFTDRDSLHYNLKGNLKDLLDNYRCNMYRGNQLLVGVLL